MSTDSFSPVPEPQREEARAAFAAAFGAASVGALTPISGGASGAHIFRVETGGRPYLMRVEGTPSPLRNPHQYESLRIASEAGIAPKLLHVDEVNRITIMDYVEQRPLHAYPGGARALAQAMGELLIRLQATPAFPEFTDYPDLVARLFAHVRRTGLFAEGLLDAHAERLAQIQKATRWNAVVSSHNDLNARNILFDGERLWLIDWESAYRSDPLVDVAILLDNLAPSTELEEVLLRSYLGRAPEPQFRERLAPIRALTRLYYAGVLLSASATQPRPAPDSDLAAPSLPAFRQVRREVRPGTLESIHTAGKMYLASFLSGDAVPELDSI